MNDLHVILGAGPLGTRLSEVLRENGYRTRLYSVLGNRAYDMPGTVPEHIEGASLDAVRGACSDAAVIYLCLNAHYVDWAPLFPAVQENAIEAAAETGAALVSSDPVYVYGKSRGAIMEGQSYTASDPEIGRARAQMAERLLSAHASGKVKAVIGRYTDFYGPGCLNSSFGSTFGQRVFYPALEGATTRILGAIDLPHTYGYLEDTVRGLVVLGQHSVAQGQAWHLPNPPTISSRELAGLVYHAAEHKPKVRGSRISGYFVRMIGWFQQDVKAMASLLYSWEQPFVVSHDKFERAFGAQTTPHAEAVQKTLDWYRLSLA